MSFSPEHLGTDVRRRLERAFCASVGVVTTVGLMLPMGVARAETVQTLVNYLQYGIAQVLYWISQGIAYFVLLLVDALIKVAQYNNFDVLPVQTGWPLVRDIVNMFFIVVLLVTAFSTIIGYSKFEYKKILPKLLLMAVLVNFSRQLIGLLIDFSQILMLTFVNGFKAAAAGNFVTALKLNKIMELAQTDQSNGLGEKDPMLLQILLSLMLGVFFLGITAITLLIMIVYLIVRVVGLWIALIFSPAALFATALPDAMGKGLNVFMGKYWSRLGAMLTGGPIMAFFLWLTLATVQSAGIDKLFTADAQSRQAEQAQAIGYFSSAVGNTEAVTTFLVAIIMLLTGLDAAVSIAGEVSKGLGDAAGAIRKQGMRATRFAAYGGVLAGGAYASRQVGRAGSAAGRYGFQRSGLEKYTGEKLQRLGLATRMSGIAAAGAKLRTAPHHRAEEAKKKLEPQLAGMSTAEKFAFFESRAEGGPLTSKAVQDTSELQANKMAISSDGKRILKSRYEKEAEDANMDPAAKKAYIAAKYQARSAEAMHELEEIATHNNDDKLFEEVRNKYDKNPSLFRADVKEEQSRFESAMADNMLGGPRTLANKLALEAYQDSRVSDLVIKEMLNSDGTVDEESAYYASFAKGNSPRSKLVQARLRELRGAAGPNGDIKALLESDRVPPQRFYTSDARIVTPEVIAAAHSHVPPTRVAGGGPVVPRNEPAVAAARERIERLRNDGAAAPRIQEAQREGMLAGAPLEEVYDMDDAGNFANNQERTNFAQNMRNVVRTGATDADVYTRLDMSALRKAPDKRNQARTAFVASADMGQMASAWRASENNAPARRAVANAVGVVHSEGARVQNVLEAHNLAHPAEAINMANVLQAAAAGNRNRVEQELGAMQLFGTTPTADEVTALIQKERIDSDPELRRFREHASHRTAAAAAGGGGAPPAGGGH